jgi:hypothetical protein
VKVDKLTCRVEVGRRRNTLKGVKKINVKPQYGGVASAVLGWLGGSATRRSELNSMKSQPPEMIAALCRSQG